MSSHLNTPITANLIDAGSRQLHYDESPPAQSQYSQHSSGYRNRFDSGADTSLGTSKPYGNAPAGRDLYAQDTSLPQYSDRNHSLAPMPAGPNPYAQDSYQSMAQSQQPYNSEQHPVRRQSYLNPLPSQMPKGQRPDYHDPERIPGLPPLSSLSGPVDHYDHVPAGPQAVGNLGREVTTVECPWCHYVVETNVKRSIGVKAGGAALITAAIAWPLFWVPLVVPGLQRKTHYCPQCKRKIGRGHRR